MWHMICDISNVTSGIIDTDYLTPGDLMIEIPILNQYRLYYIARIDCSLFHPFRKLWQWISVIRQVIPGGGLNQGGAPLMIMIETLSPVPLEMTRPLRDLNHPSPGNEFQTLRITFSVKTQNQVESMRPQFLNLTFSYINPSFCGLVGCGTTSTVEIIMI